jgi:hypothetical protein
MKKNIISGLAVFAAAAAVVAGVSSPALAAPATIAVSPTGQLDRAVASVSVTVGNVPAGQGVYVMYCQQPAAGARPTACFGRGVWASTDAKMTAQGAVALTGALSLPVALQFTPQGGTAVDCEKTVCGVFVRRDHMGPSDLSLDAFSPIAFVPAIKPVVTAVAEAGRVLFTVQGFNGKTLAIDFGGRAISRAIIADSVKFYVGNSKQKSVLATVTDAGTQVFSQSIALKK